MLCDTMPASNFVSFINVKQETWEVISRGFYRRIRYFAVMFLRFLPAIWCIKVYFGLFLAGLDFQYKVKSNYTYIKCFADLLLTVPPA